MPIIKNSKKSMQKVRQTCPCISKLSKQMWSFIFTHKLGLESQTSWVTCAHWNRKQVNIFFLKLDLNLLFVKLSRQIKTMEQKWLTSICETFSWVWATALSCFTLMTRCFHRIGNSITNSCCQCGCKLAQIMPS